MCGFIGLCSVEGAGREGALRPVAAANCYPGPLVPSVRGAAPGPIDDKNSDMAKRNLVLGSHAARWLSELVIVFVGVYAAFALDKVQERSRQRDLRQQLLGVLVEDLRFLCEEGRSHMDLDKLRTYVEGIRSGKVPLQWFALNIPYRPDVWEASLQSGGVGLLGPPLVARLSRFYGKTQGLIYHLITFDQYMRELLVPEIPEKKNAFYDEQGRLKSRYRWYLYYLETATQEIASLFAEADDLRADLEARLVRD